MDTKFTLKRKYQTSNVEKKVVMKQRKKHVDLNSMTKKQLIDEIKSLNEEIMNLKNKFQSRNQNLEANPIPIATQTTLLDEELTFPCQLCIYNADSEMDLRVHMPMIWMMMIYTPNSNVNFAIIFARVNNI